MTVTTGNFQDLVQLSQDTLYHLGPEFNVGNSAASTVTHGFSNSAGLLNLAASQSANETLWLPNTNGTLIIGVNFSAGTTSSNVSAITFSNSNNVSFGMNGATITASFNADAEAIGAIAAGTQTATSGTVVYSNSNNITFGMSGSSQITASYNFNLSAGTTSNNLNAVTFSNSNNVSFGLNGSVVTASVNADALAIGAIAAGTQTATSGTVVYSNSNNITFGMSGSSQITASYNFNLSAGTTSNNLNAVTFSNSNGISFGLNGSTLTASIATSLTNINVSAGTTSNNLSAITFSNSNNVSFGLNGSTITASFNADAQAIGAIAAGTQTATSGTVVYSNSNNITFGMSGSSQITASYNFNISAGTTSNNLNAVTFSNSNGVSFGLNGSTITASIATAQGSVNFSAGTTSNNLTAVTFSNSNNVSFGLNGSTITASVTVASTQASINVSAGTTSNNVSALTFSNSGGISFGLNGSVLTAGMGGLSSWSNGRFATALTGGQNTLFFQPIIVPYNITVTNLLWLASVSNAASNSSGGLSVSAALYTLNAGTALSLASSGSTNLTWTSGAALSSNTGINFQQMTVNSWSVTPGPYLLAFWVSTQNSASMSFYGDVQQPAISSGKVAAMSNLMLNGYSQATTNALPTSFGLSNTASYIRTGATAAEQVVMYFQGT
jgi:hypothetical protein